MGRVDPIIAPIALVNGLDLVTGNIAHFERVPQLGYPVVLIDWP